MSVNLFELAAGCCFTVSVRAAHRLPRPRSSDKPSRRISSPGTPLTPLSGRPKGNNLLKFQSDTGLFARKAAGMLSEDGWPA